MAAEDVELHRRLAKELFDGVWDLLNLERRTPEQDAEMIHMTHAAAYHSTKTGDGPRLARAEWQCSWVYSELERPEPALYHAHRCEAVCRQYADEIEDFDMPAMHEAFARAHLVAGNREEALHRLRLANDLCAKIANPDDRKIIQAQIDSIVHAAA